MFDQAYDLTAETQNTLARGRFGHFINGEVVFGSTGTFIDTISPATGQVLASLSAGSAADVDLAVKAARQAFDGPWRGFSPYQRQELLLDAVEVVRRNYRELAELESLDMGSPISRTLGSEKAMVARIRYFASLALQINGETIPNGLPGEVLSYTQKSAAGVIGGIIPWNGPLVAQWWILGAVLATGCTAVLKPAEEASLSSLRMVELLTKEVGVPAGVLNVVTGAGAVAGAALAAHPDVDRVAFTGSTETGKRIIEASTTNIKRLQLELGGKSADIILNDADLDKAVPGSAMGIFTNTGQICFAGSRVLVQRGILDDYLERVKRYAAQLKVGASLAPTTQIGPLVSERQLNTVLSYIEIAKKEGAELICGGNRSGGDLAEGYFVEPTIFANVSNDMVIARQEIFGPVMSVIPFDTIEEAIAIANDSCYGLGGGVWSRDISAALKVVNGVMTGTMWVNCYGLMDTAIGFGGVKMSGYGAKGSAAHLDNYLYTKCVYIQS